MLEICGSLRGETGRPLYVAICYFPLDTSHYAPPKRQSPYMIVDEDIWEFSRDGDVILLGDFHATIGHSQQIAFYDTSKEMLRELDICNMRLARHSHDEEHTRYGSYLRNIGTSHGLAILNGL